MARSRLVPILAVLLFVGGFVVNQSLFASAFGVTYDEPVYAAVGERHLAWLGRVARLDLGAFRHDALEAGWGNSGPTPSEADWHPPIGKELEALARRLPALGGPFGQFRAGATLLLCLTAVVLFLWLHEAAGLTAGLAAALAWLALPGAVLHGNLAALDGPVAALSTAALWLAWRTLVQPTWPRAAACGIVFGLAMATKFNAILLLPAVLAVAAWRARPALRYLLAGLLLAPVVFVAVWPWLWYDGLHHLRQVIAFHGKHSLIATQYFGRIYNDPPPPWHYPFVLLLVTTPLATLLTAGLGLVRRPRLAATPDPTAPPTALPLAPLLALAALCHVLPFANPSAAKYNGVRLFLPALPLLAALSGLGVAWLAEVLRARLPLKPDQRWVPPVVVALAVYLPAVVGILQVHPYPAAYYNLLVGGPAGAERRGLEVSYWGEPFGELLGWLSRHAPPQAQVYLHPPGAIAGMGSYRALGVLRSDLRLVHGPEAAKTADFFVYQNRPSEWDELGFELLRTRPPAYVATGGAARVGFVWSR